MLSVIEHVCVVLWTRLGYLLCKGNLTCNNTLLRGMVRTGAMLNSRHDQLLANTCVAAVVAVSDCRRTKVTKNGRRLDRFYTICIL